jgi:hexokinase
MSKMTSKQKASIVGQRAARPSRVSHRLSIIAPPCPVLKIPSLKLHDKNKERRVIDIMRPFFLMDDQIDLLKDVFWEDLKNGLSKSPERVHKSSLLMQDSYVTETLNGKEKGQYLGVDLGGTTLRIALVKLHKKRITDQINDAFHVPEAV